MATLLSAEEITTALGDLNDWTGDTAGIRRTVVTSSFRSAIRLVDAVAEAAETADHHPDIDIRYRTVTFALATHSEGGVTDRDLMLARRIDALVDGLER